MSPENLGNGSAVNSEGDVVPVDDVLPEVGRDSDVDDGIEDEAYRASRRLVGEGAASIAIQATVKPEHAKVYPATVEEVIARRRLDRPSEVERYDAHAELGGGVPNRNEAPKLPLDTVLNESFEPWQKDIRLAVEQFGLADLSLNKLEGMKDSDRMLFCLYFYAFLQNIDTNIRLIDAAEGDVNVNPALRARYGRQSQGDLNGYRRTLALLKADLEDTGAPQAVRTQLGIKPQDGGRQRIGLLQKVRRDKKAHRDREIRVVSINGKITLERSSV